MNVITDGRLVGVPGSATRSDLEAALYRAQDARRAAEVDLDAARRELDKLRELHAGCAR